MSSYNDNYYFYYYFYIFFRSLSSWLEQQERYCFISNLKTNHKSQIFQVFLSTTAEVFLCYIFILVCNSVHAYLIFFSALYSPPSCPTFTHISISTCTSRRTCTFFSTSRLQTQTLWGRQSRPGSAAIMPPLLVACRLQSLRMDSLLPFPLCDTHPGIPACKPIS